MKQTMQSKKGTVSMSQSTNTKVRPVFAVMGDMAKWNNFLLNIVLFVITITVGVFVYWSARPYNIIEWKTDQYQTTKLEYKVGEPLTYRTKFCKKGDFVAQQIRRLEDGVVYIFPNLTSSTKEGCFDFIATTTEVPNVPTGEYSFQIEFVYKVNPVREIHYQMESNRFRIVNDNSY